MLISLTEYAARHGKDPSSARRMALRGSFETAHKIGRNWAIDAAEPWPDHRIKSGKYKMVSLQTQRGAVMTYDQEALAIFRTLTKEEQLTYLSRLRALADTPASAPAPPGEAPGTTA